MIFLDGVGLGGDDPAVNPFCVANTPTLNALANGHRWLRQTGRQSSERAEFIPTDPRLGIAGIWAALGAWMILRAIVNHRRTDRVLSPVDAD